MRRMIQTVICFKRPCLERSKLTDLPLDCIYYFSNWFQNPKDVFSMLLTCKEFYSAFMCERSFSCESIVFKFGSKALGLFPFPTTTKFPYVRRLSYRGVKGEKPKYTPGFLKRFPKLFCFITHSWNASLLDTSSLVCDQIPSGPGQQASTSAPSFWNDLKELKFFKTFAVIPPQYVQRKTVFPSRHVLKSAFHRLRRLSMPFKSNFPWEALAEMPNLRELEIVVDNELKWRHDSSTSGTTTTHPSPKTFPVLPQQLRLLARNFGYMTFPSYGGLYYDTYDDHILSQEFGVFAEALCQNEQLMCQLCPCKKIVPSSELIIDKLVGLGENDRQGVYFRCKDCANCRYCERRINNNEQIYLGATADYGIFQGCAHLPFHCLQCKQIITHDNDENSSECIVCPACDYGYEMECTGCGSDILPICYLGTCSVSVHKKHTVAREICCECCRWCNHCQSLDHCNDSACGPPKCYVDSCEHNNMNYESYGPKMQNGCFDSYNDLFSRSIHFNICNCCRKTICCFDHTMRSCRICYQHVEEMEEDLCPDCFPSRLEENAKAVCKGCKKLCCSACRSIACQICGESGLCSSRYSQFDDDDEGVSFCLEKCHFCKRFVCFAESHPVDPGNNNSKCSVRVDLSGLVACKDCLKKQTPSLTEQTRHDKDKGIGKGS